MDKGDLDKLGYETEGYVPGADYVPHPEDAESSPDGGFVIRTFLQLEQLNAMGGVKLLGGSRKRLDDIYVAMEDGVDLERAVERLGDDGQKQRVRELIESGQVSGT